MYSEALFMTGSVGYVRVLYVLLRLVLIVNVGYVCV